MKQKFTQRQILTQEQVQERELDASVLEQYIGKEVLVEGHYFFEAITGELAGYGKNYIELTNLTSMESTFTDLIDAPILNYSPEDVPRPLMSNLTISKNYINGIVSWKSFIKGYYAAKNGGKGK